MSKSRMVIGFLVFLAVILSNAVVFADIELPAIIGDNMVLQAGEPVGLWGWADPGEKVSVDVSWHTMTWAVTADEQGKWKFKVTAPEAGGPHEITLKGKNEVKVSNILAGEVWVCSGQSNMQWPVSAANNAPEEIAAADYPKMRLFSVKREVADEPQADCEGQWVECSPETVPNFTAVGYFFGRELHKELKVPVGLIHTSWGGTPAEAWTSEGFLKSNDEFTPILERYKNAVDNWDSIMAEHEQKVQEWEKKAAAARAEGKKAPGGRPRRPYGPGHPHSPSGLFNAMIAPIIPYGIQGAIWYQGESNAGRAYQYRELFPAMINSWRSHWAQGDFPFLFVQLANFMQAEDEPGDSAWAELREAQTMALNLKNTGMAVIIDIGEADDIHPRNKQDVGKRLALWALNKTYGRNVVYSGPLYKSMEVEGNKVILQFTNIDGGLVAKGGEPLKGFAIAGEDKKFVWADARIEDNKVVVSSEKVSEPVAVRYAWADNPVCNLYNEAGLPASPFRTDQWPGVTQGKK